MRYERKYRIDHWSYDYVLHEILSNPAAFDYSYEDRWINSIYYDDVDFKALNENVFGISNRVKYRLRWYGEDIHQINDPILEKKIKKNVLGTKAYQKVESIDLLQNFDAVNNIDLIKENNLHPVVLIRYRRTYLESFDRKIRATIDRDLTYYGIHNNQLTIDKTEDNALILEIKYEQKDEKEVDYCLQSIPFRLTKNSKFVSGMMGNWL